MVVPQRITKVGAANSLLGRDARIKLRIVGESGAKRPNVAKRDGGQ